MDSGIHRQLKNAYESRDTLHFDLPSEIKDRFELVRQALRGNILPTEPGYYLLIKTTSTSKFFILTREVTGGSDPKNEIVFASKFVSSVHCRFDCVEGNWRVIDLQSRNGTSCQQYTLRRVPVEEWGRYHDRRYHYNIF